jgi:hypothetical protein
MTTRYFHLTARTHVGLTPLSAHAVARWLWQRFRRAFPDALGAVIMPDHLHLIASSDEPHAARAALALIVGNLARSGLMERRLSWAVPSPQAIADRQKLLRQLRYVALNPVRAQLVADPLSWPWSTHRDVLGAIADPWVRAADLAPLVAPPAWRHDFAARYHHYVSADPTCNLEGTELGHPATNEQLCSVPLAWLAEAAASCLRAEPLDVQRRTKARALFLELARHAGVHPRKLGPLCAMTANGVHARWASGSVRSAQLDAAKRCALDPRLRRWSFEATKWRRSGQLQDADANDDSDAVRPDFAQGP